MRAIERAAKIAAQAQIREQAVHESAIKRAEEVAKRQAAEAKRQQKLNQQEAEAAVLYANYKLDCDRSVADDEDIVETWTKQKAPIIASAYAIFVKPTLGGDDPVATTKTTMLPALKVIFIQKYHSEQAAAGVAMDL